MGVFWDQAEADPQYMVDSFSAALRTPPPQQDALVEDLARTHARAASVRPAAKLNVGRLIAALVIVGVLLGAGIACNSAHLHDAEKTLFSLATTAFGVVVGLLTGKS
jgi:hypothetical protein